MVANDQAKASTAVPVIGSRVPQALKRAAREAVKAAVRSGRLVMPPACERCGTTHDNLHAHHDNYYKQLEVRWLCVEWCHPATHDELDDLDRSAFLYVFGKTIYRWDAYDPAPDVSPFDPELGYCSPFDG